MFSAGCCSSTHVEFHKFLTSHCVSQPHSLCASAQRSNEVSLDLFPSTPRIQLRRRMQRSRTANDQGQQGDQWIKCSVNGWQVYCDKIQRQSWGISAATFVHVFLSNMSVNCSFITPVLAISQSCLTRLSIGSRTVWVFWLNSLQFFCWYCSIQILNYCK